jgi:hypothetical protein
VMFFAVFVIIFLSSLSFRISSVPGFFAGETAG